MKPLIPVASYTDPAIFKQEQARLFNSLWMFAGFTKDLAQSQDYVTRNIAGQQVFVQNFQGQLRAFDNVCSHRFSLIHQQLVGHGAVQCPYHSWTYNQEGIPVGIPHLEEFPNFSEADRCRLRLREWQVEVCGQFVFVKAPGSQFSGGLREFLGPAWDILTTFSAGMGNQLDRYPMRIRANWKVVVENTLESYHIWSVHSESLAKHGPVEENFNLYPHHSLYRSQPRKTPPKTRKFLATFKDRQLELEGYQHCLIFPLLTLATFSGLSLSVHVINPQSPGETQATNYTFCGRLKDPSYEKILQDMSGQSAAALTRQAWQEDRPICVLVQQGIASLDQNQPREGIFSQEEQRVYHFHQAYMAAMAS